MKMTVIFAGIIFLLTNLVSVPVLSGQEEKIAIWKIKKEKNNTYLISAKVVENGCLYQSQLQIEMRNGKNKLLSVTPLFKSKKIKDPVSGENTEVLEGKNIYQWIVKSSLNDYPLHGKISFQGCWKGGDGKEPLCLFPEYITFTIRDGSFEFADLNSPPEEETKSDMKGENKPSTLLPSFTILRSFAGSTSEKEFLSFIKGKKDENIYGNQSFLEGKSILLVILLTLLGGFALNLTPCVLPMIPLNLAIIGASGKNESRSNKILRGVVYGGGIAIAYGVLGVICILTGSSMGALDSSWIFNCIVALVMVLLGLSLFDLYAIDLTKLGNKIGRPSSAKLAGVFLMGVMTSILAGACVAPVVAAVLIYSSNLYMEGSPIALLLPFVLGLGMALPWPIAAGGLSILPKPGKWMVKVKYLFGIFIIVLGIYYGYQSYRIMDHLYIKKNSPEESLKVLLSSMERARKEKKPLFIAFGAIWCKNCAVMKKSVLQKKSVKDALKDYIFTEFDASNVTDKTIDKILKSMKVNGLPTYVILNVP